AHARPIYSWTILPTAYLGKPRCRNARGNGLPRLATLPRGLGPAAAPGRLDGVPAPRARRAVHGIPAVSDPAAIEELPGWLEGRSPCRAWSHRGGNLARR